MTDPDRRPRHVRGTDVPADAGRPSTRARERLESDFAAELGLTRAAWDDALLRGDDRLRAQDTVGVLEVLEDQRRLLQLLERRLQGVVSSAAVEREAERVVGTTEPVPLRPDVGVGDSAAGASTTAAREASTATHPRRWLAGAGLAAGVVAVAATLGMVLGVGAPPTPQVAGPGDPSPHAASDGVEDEQAVSVAGRDGAFDAGPGPDSAWLRDLLLFGAGGNDLLSEGANPPAAGAAPPAERDPVSGSESDGEATGEEGGGAPATGDASEAPTVEPERGAGESTEGEEAEQDPDAPREGPGPTDGLPEDLSLEGFGDLDESTEHNTSSADPTGDDLRDGLRDALGEVIDPS